MDQFKPEAGDPLHQPGQGSLIWQLGAKGGRARTYGDLAVVEFRAQCGAGLAVKVTSYVCDRSTVRPRSLLVQRAASVPGGWVCVITPPRVIRDLAWLAVTLATSRKAPWPVSSGFLSRISGKWGRCRGGGAAAVRGASGPPGSRWRSSGRRRCPPRWSQDRLHGRLTAGAGKRLTVVVGSAGAGKSVLLSSWAAARPPGLTSWLSCDEADLTRSVSGPASSRPPGSWCRGSAPMPPTCWPWTASCRPTSPRRSRTMPRSCPPAR